MPLIKIDDIKPTEGLAEFEGRLCELLKEAKYRFGWTERTIVPGIKLLWEDMELIEKYGSLEEAFSKLAEKNK